MPKATRICAWAGAITGLLIGLAVFVPSIINVLIRLERESKDPFANLFAGAGAYLILMSLIGMVGVALLTRKPRQAGRLLLVSGVAGFFLGAIVLPGFIFWIIPGPLLIISGLQALKIQQFDYQNNR